MWVFTCLVPFAAASYEASVHSWPAIEVWIDRAAVDADRLRKRVTKLEAELRGF